VSRNAFYITGSWLNNYYSTVAVRDLALIKQKRALLFVPKSSVKLDYSRVEVEWQATSNAVPSSLDSRVDRTATCRVNNRLRD